MVPRPHRSSSARGSDPGLTAGLRRPGWGRFANAVTGRAERDSTSRWRKPAVAPRSEKPWADAHGSLALLPYGVAPSITDVYFYIFGRAQSWRDSRSCLARPTAPHGSAAGLSIGLAAHCPQRDLARRAAMRTTPPAKSMMAPGSGTVCCWRWMVPSLTLRWSSGLAASVCRAP